MARFARVLLTRFIKECCDRIPGAREPEEKVREALAAWCDRNQEPEQTEVEVAKTLMQEWKFALVRDWFWDGLQLRHDD